MANEEKNEKYVTELAGPDDRWVSVTDAARISRRQEKTIRDWVESGRLPVHPVRVGINKRTRQVRLSDLATLTPIIDPEAGITTELGLLDLPSIPRVQQQLREQMEMLQRETGEQVSALTERIGSLAVQHDQFIAEARQNWAVHQEQYQALDRRAEDLQQKIQQAGESWTESLQEVGRNLRQELAQVLDLHQQLAGRVSSQAEELQQARTDLADLVAQSEQALRLVLSEQVGQSEARLREALTTLSGQFGEIEQALRSEQVSGVSRLEKTIGDLDARMQESLTGCVTSLQEAMTVLHDQALAQIQGATEALQTTWHKRAAAAESDARQLQRDLAAQARDQQALKQRLDEERTARLALAKQVEKLLQGQQKGKGRGQAGD